MDNNERKKLQQFVVVELRKNMKERAGEWEQQVDAGRWREITRTQRAIQLASS